MQRQERNKQVNKPKTKDSGTITLFQFDKVMMYFAVIPFILLGFLTAIQGHEDTVLLFSCALVFGLLAVGSRMEKEKRVNGKNTENLTIFLWFFASFAFFNIVMNTLFAVIFAAIVIGLMLKFNMKLNTNWLTVAIATFHGINILYGLFQDYEFLTQVSYAFTPKVYDDNFWMYLLAFSTVFGMGYLANKEDKEEQKAETVQEKEADVEVTTAEPTTASETTTEKEQHIIEETQPEQKQKSKKSKQEEEPNEKAFFVTKKTKKTKWKEEIDKMITKFLKF